MRSGITLDNNLKEEAQKIEKDTSGMCFVFNGDNTKIVLEENSFVPKDHPAPFEAITDTFHNDNCRFGFLSIKVGVSDANCKELVLLAWAGDEAPVKQKFTFSTAVEAVKKGLQPKFKHYMEMNDEDDKSISNFIDKIANKREIKSFQGRPVSLCKETHTYSYTD